MINYTKINRTRDINFTYITNTFVEHFFQLPKTSLAIEKRNDCVNYTLLWLGFTTVYSWHLSTFKSYLLS